MIFPSYLIHESSMSSKKITEVIMKESVIAKYMLSEIDGLGR